MCNGLGDPAFMLSDTSGLGDHILGSMLRAPPTGFNVSSSYAIDYAGAKLTVGNWDFSCIHKSDLLVKWPILL